MKINNMNFFSKNLYIVLPTKRNPKVFLAIKHINRKECFKLYQPYSLKVKLLKKVAFYFPIFNIVKKEKSDLIRYLDQRFNKSFVSSLYLSTDKNKIIIQLQENKKVFGYLKIGITPVGSKKVKHELNAIKILQEINNIKIIDSGIFDGAGYFISERLKGESGFLSEKKVNKILVKLERNQTFHFNKHPRVQYIKDHLEKLSLIKYIDIFNSINIDKRLKLVYEHGDFAPWNIIIHNNTVKVFDFEYFTEDGLEQFDLIKYYFQIETLLNRSSYNDVILKVLSKLDSLFKKELFILFLLKEILIKKEEGLSIDREDNLLNILIKL